jgi:predicted nucleic acid-binding protein
MKVFVDTSALFALLDEDDLHHAEAGMIYRGLLGAADLVTSNYIHVESEQLVRRRLGERAAVRLQDELIPPIETVWIDEPTHRAAVAAKRAAASSASLVDQASFVVMRAAAIEVAFAFDADFEVEGFRRAFAGDLERGHRLSEPPAPYVDAAAASPELVSVTEIAVRTGRPVNTIQSWRRRHDDFPPPLAALAAGPVWAWRDVEDWVAARERRGRRRGSVLDLAGIAGSRTRRIPGTAEGLDRLLAGRQGA